MKKYELWEKYQQTLWEKLHRIYVISELDFYKALDEWTSQHSANVLVSGNEAIQKENKKEIEVAVAFADWLADKGYVRANCFGKGEDEMYKEGLFKEFEIETAKATDR